MVAQVVPPAKRKFLYEWGTIYDATTPYPAALWRMEKGGKWRNWRRGGEDRYEEWIGRKASRSDDLDHLSPGSEAEQTLFLQKCLASIFG